MTITAVSTRWATVAFILALQQRRWWIIWYRRAKSKNSFVIRVDRLDSGGRGRKNSNMPILVRCPACKTTAEVSRAAIGVSAQCKQSKNVFPVPPGSGHLLVEWGVPLVGTRVPLSPPHELRIGRADENELVLPGAKVSRHHAKIIWRDDEWIIQDLESGNGTFVNGKQVRETRL